MQPMSDEEKILCDMIGRFTNEVAEKASYEDIQKVIIDCLDKMDDLYYCAFELFKLAVRNGCYMKSYLYTEITKNNGNIDDVLVLLWDSVYDVIEEGEENR